MAEALVEFPWWPLQWECDGHGMRRAEVTVAGRRLIVIGWRDGSYTVSDTDRANVSGVLDAVQLRKWLIEFTGQIGGDNGCTEATRAGAAARAS